MAGSRRRLGVQRKQFCQRGPGIGPSNRTDKIGQKSRPNHVIQMLPERLARLWQTGAEIQASCTGR